MKHTLLKRGRVSQTLLLLYFVLLAALGLPLALGALKLNLDYRRQAETVTIRATLPPNPFNTPNYRELYNKPVTIDHEAEVAIITGRPVESSILVTDPDWVPGLSSPQTRFSSASSLPSGLKILCVTTKKTKTCKLTGTAAQALTQPQTITIIATDALEKQTKATLTLH